MSEWHQRQLCPDGACIGVIGSDGTCKVCGRAAPNWGDERKRGMIDEPEAVAANPLLADEDDDDDDDYEDDGADDAGYEDDDDDDDDDDDEAAAASSEASPDWEERKLCPDEACIGVIGDDGKCKVCGRSAA